MLALELEDVEREKFDGLSLRINASKLSPVNKLHYKVVLIWIVMLIGASLSKPHTG